MTLQTNNPTWSPARSLAIRVHLERASDETSPSNVRTMQLIYALELLAVARHEIPRETELADNLTLAAGWLRAAILGEHWRIQRIRLMLADPADHDRRVDPLVAALEKFD